MMLKSLRYLPTLVVGMLLGVSIALTHGVFAEREEGTGEVARLPLESLHTFAEIFTHIKNDYVEEVSDEKLIEYAIEGMLTGLDPHSAYLNPDSYKDLQVGTTGEFGGLGIEVGMEDGFVKVISPIDDTPAQRAGIKAGDLIIRLDKIAVKGMSLSDAVKVMRGKPGTDITLTVVREGEDKPLKFTITRDIIQVKSVKSRLLEPGYAYIRISQFQTHTAEDLRNALNNLRTESGSDLKGLVLDLRNNPGGVLSAAVEVADTFIEKGLIVYTKGRDEESELKFKARPKDLLERSPMVVLVNSGSASASEIVAGALQDHKRAVIMGTKTFGKGSVQTILPMNNQAALKLTTALYYTPSGRSIQAEGIKPDILLSKVEIASVAEDDEDALLSESDLVGHIKNGKSDSDSKVPPVEEKPVKKQGSEQNDEEETKRLLDKSSDKKEKDVPLVKADYAVYEALNLLKGLSIISSR